MNKTNNKSQTIYKVPATNNIENVTTLNNTFNKQELKHAILNDIDNHLNEEVEINNDIYGQIYTDNKVMLNNIVHQIIELDNPIQLNVYNTENENYNDDKNAAVENDDKNADSYIEEVDDLYSIIKETVNPVTEHMVNHKLHNTTGNTTYMNIINELDTIDGSIDNKIINYNKINKLRSKRFKSLSIW